MRRKQRITEESAARALLAQAPFYQLATTTPEGTPVLRTLNGVLTHEWILFHGAFAGEKSDCLGRPAVVEAYRVVADIPSYFVDAQKGCPATTYFRSAQAKGMLLDVSEPSLKIEMLDALMGKYQPEGGHEPFSSPIYKKDLRGVRVFGLRIEEITGKMNMGQDRPPERTELVVRGLWNRGAPGDPAALEEILDASPRARPAEWYLGEGAARVTFRVHADEASRREHARLLFGQYWRLTSSEEEIMRAIESSNAWVGAYDEENRLLGAARASSDYVWVASVSDVVVQERARGRGIGQALMRLLLGHPAVRGCTATRLGTQDAIGFYERFGFTIAGISDRGFASHPMTRLRESL